MLHRPTRTQRTATNPASRSRHLYAADPAAGRPSSRSVRRSQTRSVRRWRAARRLNRAELASRAVGRDFGSGRAGSGGAVARSWCGVPLVVGVLGGSRLLRYGALELGGLEVVE